LEAGKEFDGQNSLKNDETLNLEANKLDFDNSYALGHCDIGGFSMQRIDVRNFSAN
jgi:hypothetical protein